MGAGGLSKRLLALADYLPGGDCLGQHRRQHVLCRHISDSGPATVAAIGMLTTPAMMERGYDRGAIVAATGAIRSHDFPAIPLCGLAGIHRQTLSGGIIPGILTGLTHGFPCFYDKKRGWLGEKTGKKSCWDAKWALLVPVIVLGGIYGGASVSQPKQPP